MNHSCAPNCVVVFSRAGRQEIRTGREVAAGEELCHFYTDLCAPTAVRRGRLQKQFDFVCGCSHCTREGFELSHALLGPEGGGSERLLQARGYMPSHAVTYLLQARRKLYGVK